MRVRIRRVIKALFYYVASLILLWMVVSSYLFLTKGDSSAPLWVEFGFTFALAIPSAAISIGIIALVDWAFNG